MIGFFFTALSFLIIARVIFSFIGYNYGAIYDFVYTYSEKILKPIRKFLPPSRVDWSPFIALIFIDIFSKLLDPLVFYIVNGQFEMIIPLFIHVFVSLLSSITVFLIIIFIVKIVNDIVKDNNQTLTNIIDPLTEPFIAKIRKRLPFGYKKHSAWVVLGLLILIKMLLQSIYKI